MKFNYKSRKGFTLIELLVVIGILAVLAAIAIPSVAGLIDRANVSADNTNANEMTNALERFASEYELYCQDIASGSVNPADLDSAQGRVYNVTKATTRTDITKLESEDGLNGVKINRDTKYPMNHDTMKAIVENYMKTSSSTFEPKQSDCNYYYSPDCGIVVCTETDKASTTDLNALVVSGKDAKGKELGPQTQWINITEGASAGNNSTVDMSTVDSTLANNDWATIKAVIQAGKVSDAGWKAGDLTPSFTINGSTKQARIVDINGNKVTFMLTSRIGKHNMNAASADYQWGDNIGGYADSEMKVWLDETVYNGLDADLKAVISPTTITCADGYNSPNGTKSATCYLFLPSIKEVGLNDDISGWYSYMTAIEAEGETFDWFAEGGCIDRWFWLRSPRSNYVTLFFGYGNGSGSYDTAHRSYSVYPAFVIG